jgi:hypothetical protein
MLREFAIPASAPEEARAIEPMIDMIGEENFFVG